MLIVAPLFFYSKYKEDKAVENKGGMAFNLGYMIFFIFTSLNELVYIIDAIGEYSAVLGWDPILAAGITNTLVFEYTLKSQIIIMLCLFFWSFVAIMYPIEKYIQKKKKFTVTILLLIGGIGSGLLWFIFCYLRVPLSVELIWLQIIIGLVFGISIIGLAISVLAFSYFYLKLAFSSTGIIRKKSFIIFFGLFFMYFSLIGGNLFRPDVEGTLLELMGPIALMLGIFVLIYGFRLKGT
jgi:hypothetical protein